MFKGTDPSRDRTSHLVNSQEVLHSKGPEGNNREPCSYRNWAN